MVVAVVVADVVVFVVPSHSPLSWLPQRGVCFRSSSGIATAAATAAPTVFLRSQAAREHHVATAAAAAAAAAT